MNRNLLVIIALSFVLATCVVIWVIRDVPAPYAAAPEVPARQPLDTTGGQQMQPRWSEPAGEGE
ncbi:hypothetical protein MIC97_20275 [Aquamicrobium sp. NLF2-7]|uniref:hypothetical protein n=1 Tax=Aquamicrobium sp. NLF2-7 TaxID=2918753 RepID=UPI001EFAD4AC|nr:hypothetical protein [Aquamicrobium sp. NLF2-7]MCG8273825.1 hypothetical protein [Aquamicrobium sp. NLF2-7]